MPKVVAAAALLGIVFLTGCNTQFELPPSESAATGSGSWCADFASDLGTNCGFVSLDQCRAAISGVNGHCYPNPERGVTAPQATRSQ